MSASRGSRDRAGGVSGSGKVTVAGSARPGTRDRRLTRRCPTPSGRADAGAAAGRRSRRTDRPTRSVAEVDNGAVPTTRTPSTRHPLVDPRSVTLTVVDRTSTTACRRERSGSSRRRSASAARPIRCSPGGSRKMVPASGPETTCSSSTPGASRSGSTPRPPRMTRAPSRRGGVPMGCSGRSRRPWIRRPGALCSDPASSVALGERAAASSAAVAVGDRAATSSAAVAPGTASTSMSLDRCPRIASMTVIRSCICSSPQPSHRFPGARGGTCPQPAGLCDSQRGVPSRSERRVLGRRALTGCGRPNRLRASMDPGRWLYRNQWGHRASRARG